MNILAEKKLRNALLFPQLDFWFLGGLSIFFWVILLVFNMTNINQNKLLPIYVNPLIFFATLSIFFNFPHFLVSYRFAYSRGWQFIKKNWFSLIFIPTFLFFIYSYSYLYFESPFLYTDKKVGPLLIALSVHIMYFTVGWHYSKQVYGCMMVYAHYTLYPLTKNQKMLIKLSVFSVAFLNFLYTNIYAPEYFNDSRPNSIYVNIPLFVFDLPKITIPIAFFILSITAITTLVFVFLKNYRVYGKKPPLNFIISWLAFYFWWIPLKGFDQFFLMAVPVFHAIQYLPFAYSLEFQPHCKKVQLKIVMIKILILMLIGFLAFRGIPSFLDYSFNTVMKFNTWFFLIVFGVFINIHHFFIDSVIWRFDDRNIREKILH